MSANENTGKTIPSQRLSQETFVVMLTSFIRLRDQVTKLRLVNGERATSFVILSLDPYRL